MLAFPRRVPVRVHLRRAKRPCKFLQARRCDVRRLRDARLLLKLGRCFFARTLRVNRFFFSMRSQGGKWNTTRLLKTYLAAIEVTDERAHAWRRSSHVPDRRSSHSYIFGRVLMTSGHGDKVLVVLDYSEKDTYLTACLEHDHFKSKFVGLKRATRGCKK